MTGVVQFGIARAGMRSAARAEGLSGIGVAWSYGLAVAIVSIILLTVTALLIDLRLWGLAGFGIFVMDIAMVGAVWTTAQRLGLHGDSRVIVFVAVLSVELMVLAMWWPTHET